MKRIYIGMSAVVLAGALAWFVYEPSWEPAVAGLSALAALIGIFAVDREPSSQQAVSATPGPVTFNVSGNNPVVSNNQTGGITAQNVLQVDTRTSADADMVFLEEDPLIQLPDGQYEAKVLFEIQSPFPVGNFSIHVQAPGLSFADVGPVRPGGSFLIAGHTGYRENAWFTNIPNAFGKYRLTVRCRDPQQIAVTYNFQ